MTTKEKAARAGAAVETTVNTSSLHCSVSETDKLTVLETVGPCLTKTYKSDGTTDSYDDAASFHYKQVEVTGLPGLVSLLGKLHANKKRCLIRGAPKGEGMEEGSVPGTVTRTNANFLDQPLHWFMCDIDGYRPGFADPVLEPEQAVLDYIEECLPASFKGASFYWHLSSSAGMPGKEGILKVHLHFWSKTAYATAQMAAWVKTTAPTIDRAIFRRVQIHYTADPIFEPGRTDPVPVRCGFHQGTTDAVDLVIDEATLAKARDQGAGEGGSDMVLKDPSEKEGLIGAFHKAFTAEDVLLNFLDEFEQVTERRYTWSGGGGTPEGVWIHDDGQHIGSSHNTWPIDGIANLWDLVRVFKFGDLDPAEGAEEDFESIGANQVGSRPSDLAMKAWAAQLPELKEVMAEEEQAKGRERQATLEDWRDQIQAAPDEYTVREVLCPQIASDDSLTALNRDALAVDVNAKLGRLAGNKPGLAHAKKLLAPPPVAQLERDVESGPAWLRGWYYVTDQDKFFRYDSDEWLTMQGFNSKYSRNVPPGDEGGRIPATVFALEVHPIPTVTRGMYLPGAEVTFRESNTKYVNTYRPSSVPKEAAVLDKKGKAVVELVKQHVLALVNGREWLADLLLDWIAHNVQNPGEKIRYSFVIQGVEGDGKSLIGDLLGRILGQVNVRIISPEVVSKGDFNGWAEGACVGVLEELRLQGNNRFDVLNSVKPCVTNVHITIHRKRQDPYNAVNTMNYIAFTNHKDALPLDDTDRRWVVVFAPWENIGQFEQRVGCGNDVYFERLFTALDQGAGYLRRYFLERDLSKFNRNGRAPDTDEKRIMVSLGASDELSTARGLIAEGGYGFGPDVVSTSELSTAMEAAGVEAPQSIAMNRMMVKLGFQKVVGQIKWDNRPHRVWTRKAVTEPDAIRSLLDATASRQLENDFED